jgi:DNA-binding transcriptional LysR family regulator
MHTVHLSALDLNLAVVLHAVSTERSVSRAAKRLGLSQSATSHALARLRNLLGDPLFVRTPHGLTPTPRAQSMLEPLDTAMGLLEQVLLPAPAFEPSTAIGRFRVAATDYAEFLLLPPLLGLLSRRSPGLKIWVRPLAEVATEALRRSEIELAIGVFNLRELGRGLRAAALLEDRFVCMVRADDPLARGRLTLARFLAAEHALIAPRGVPGGPVDDALAALGHQRKVAATVPHFLVAPHIVAQTDLVLTLAARIASAFAATLSVRVLEPPLELPGVRLSMLWHERNDADAAHRWMRERLVEVAANAPPLLGRRKRPKA